MPSKAQAPRRKATGRTGLAAAARLLSASLSDGRSEDPLISLWQEWRETFASSQRLCREAQRLERDLVKKIGFPRVEIPLDDLGRPSVVATDARQIDQVLGTAFSAWKGITFYEYQLRRIAPRVRTIITWLRSRECVPADLKMHRPYDEHLLMHIDWVGHMLNATLLDIRHILGEYEKGFRALMNGSPSLFREFLRTIHAHYWLLGYCVSALISVVHLDNRCMKNLPSRHVDFETLSRLLRQFDVALDRRREQKSAF